MERRHNNDALSVDAFVEEMKNSNDNPILIYKRQGLFTENYSDFSADDFMLGIMTRAQLEMSQKFDNNGIICMDATHLLNQYDFKLITILTTDECNEGYPIAFLFSDKENYSVLKHFINAVKNKVGNIKCNIFMSDDAEQYFSAWSYWSSVMSTDHGVKKLLCTWHVDRAWRSKLSLIKTKEKQQFVYKTLCRLREESNLQQFYDLLSSTVTKLKKDKDTSDYIMYFEQMYGERPATWAYCFRLGCGINTNI